MSCTLTNIELSLIYASSLSTECQKACGNCVEKVTATDTCLNDPGFYVDENDEHDCRWIRWKKDRRDDHCNSDEVQKVSTLPNNAESNVIFSTNLFPFQHSHHPPPLPF